jgi:hypothetical protein
MGRLEIEIRHGRDGGGPAQWGAVVALIVFVLLAAAGHKEIGTVMHEVLTVVEITAYAAVGLLVLAVTVFIVSRRRAVRRAHARYRYARPVTVRTDGSIRVLDADETPALDAPRRRTAGWPLPGDWDEITPRDDDRRRYS